MDGQRDGWTEGWRRRRSSWSPQGQGDGGSGGGEMSPRAPGGCWGTEGRRGPSRPRGRALPTPPGSGERTAISSPAIKQIGVCWGERGRERARVGACVCGAAATRVCAGGVVSMRVLLCAGQEPPPRAAPGPCVCARPCTRAPTHPRVWVLSSAEAGCPAGVPGGGILKWVPRGCAVWVAPTQGGGPGGSGRGASDEER